MGGKPQWFLVTVGLPAHTPVATMESLYQGIASCVSRYQASVVGGETTSVPHGASMVISIAATGVVNKSHLVLRSTAQNGDCVFVTGKLGGSLAGRHLDITPRIDEAQWLAARKFPTAMMDLSDGIATDLPRLATASGLGYELLPEALPCYDGCIISQALTDGEDYELLFTVAPRRIRALTAQWHKTFPHTPLTCIGTMVPAGNGMQLEGGWNHFGKP
jgi:thiamine-monophosphate kinase